jgi:hypothetical protein
MMSLSKAIAFSVIFSVPMAVLAQSNQPASRAEVRANLVQVEKAGFDPCDFIHYPENLQTAEAKIAAHNAAMAQNPSSGYGGEADGAVYSGRAPGKE